MELTDIVSIQEWAQFEKELFDRFRMNSTVYNTSGVGVTGKPHWCNHLCPEIKGNKNSLSAICAPGNQHFMAQARRTKKPVIGQCDAGLMKIAVPIFVNGDFLGTAGGCGRLPAGGEVEALIIETTLGLSKTEIDDLSGGLETMTEEQAKEMAAFIEKRIAQYMGKTATESLYS